MRKILTAKSSTFYVYFILFIATFSLMNITGCSSPDKQDEGNTYVFKNATVIDAVTGLREGQSVVVRGNKIVETGSVDETKEPRDATVVDCNNKYLIPGLWDAHMHLTNSEVLLPAMFPLLTATGITYIRDTAAELKKILPLREKAEKEAQTSGMAPRIFMIGPHMDSKNLIWSSSVSVVTPEQAEFIIDCLINAGVDELKVYDLLPRDIYFAVQSIANERNYKLCAHVPFSVDAVEASNAGLDCMEHMSNLEFSCSVEWETLLQERLKMLEEGSEIPGGQLRNEVYDAQRLRAFRSQDEERRDFVLKTLAANDTWQVPTLVITSQEEHRIYARDDFKETFRYLPEPLRTEWRNNANSRAQKPPSEVELAHSYWAYDMIPRLVEAGINIMAGTDMPLALLTPGFSLHEELALLVKYGLTPMQAIESATLKPAEYYGLEAQQGSIAEGMMADLVILDANPLEDIRNTLKINAVMRNGFLHTREKLDHILSQLEQYGEVRQDGI
jgi:hypothetical protein